MQGAGSEATAQKSLSQREHHDPGSAASIEDAETGAQQR